MTEQNYSNVSPQRIQYAGRHAYMTKETDAKPVDEETRIVAAARAAAKLEGKNMWLTFRAIAGQLILAETPLYAQFLEQASTYAQDVDDFAEWLSHDFDKHPAERVDIVCAQCGEGEGVTFSGYCKWNPRTQEMDVTETDNPCCSECSTEANTIELPIAEGKGRV